MEIVMNSRDARTRMLTEVRINTMLTILGTNHIETLDEFNHADPDDYGSMYQALRHLYKVSGTINEEDRIATHVERDLASEFEPSARRTFLNLYAWEPTRYKETDNDPAF